MTSTLTGILGDVCVDQEGLVGPWRAAVLTFCALNLHTEEVMKFGWFVFVLA